MTGLDILLANALGKTIRENLGKKTMQKIEKRLHEKFGTDLAGALHDFYKIDSVLREYFGAGADGLEKKFLDGVVQIDKAKNSKHGWLTLESEYLTKIILESIGDEDKKAIINALLDTPRNIYEILDICKIPQTSGYRKINSLINDGLLVPANTTISPDGKKIIQYIALFENIKIDIQKNRIVIKAQISNDTLEKSSIVQVMQSTK
jgi:hypothetical protein